MVGEKALHAQRSEALPLLGKRKKALLRSSGHREGGSLLGQWEGRVDSMAQGLRRESWG